MNGNSEFTEMNLDCYSAVEKPSMETEGMTVEQIIERIKEEHISDEENSFPHYFYPNVNEQTISNHNLQQETPPISIYVKEEHECAAQSTLDADSIKNENTKEGGWCGDNQTQELTAGEHRQNFEFYLAEQIKYAMNSGTFRCRFCEYETKTKRNFKKHNRMKHDEHCRMFQCEFCDYKTKANDKLKQHVKVKHDRNCEIFKCEFCEYTTKTKGNLAKHFKVKHYVNSETYKCEFCNYKTKAKDNFKRHMKMKHAENYELLKCGSCEYATRWNNALKRHIKMKHERIMKVEVH